MKPIFVPDACSLISFFNDEAGADVVQDLLVKTSHDKGFEDTVKR
jgi:hypothetical protein